MLSKLEKLINEAQSKIEPLQTRIAEILNNEDYSDSYKIRKKMEIEDEADEIRNKLLEDVIKLLDEAVSEAENTNTEIYATGFDAETLCKIQFIKDMKEELTVGEVEALINANENNNVILKYLYPLAEKYNLNLNKIKFAQIQSNRDSIKSFREKVVGLITNLVITKSYELMPLTLAMMIANEKL